MSMYGLRLASMVALACVAGTARAQNVVVGALDEPPPQTADVARQGQFLPLTFSPVIGHKQVIGLFVGGYDSAVGQGPAFSALVEGELFNRVSVRAGVDYRDAIHSVYPSVGVRVGILRQERNHIDLSVLAQYKNLGFSEASGELELAALLGHRWSHFGFFANAIYGQGLDAGERDAELRAALLYYVHPLINVGLDVRSRIDLGDDDPARQKARLESDFDFVAGATASVTVLKHLALIAEVGPHVVIFQERTSAGVTALGGIGATY